jgi:hypothetical protein
MLSGLNLCYEMLKLFFVFCFCYVVVLVFSISISISISILESELNSLVRTCTLFSSSFYTVCMCECMWVGECFLLVACILIHAFLFIFFFFCFCFCFCFCFLFPVSCFRFPVSCFSSLHVLSLCTTKPAHPGGSRLQQGTTNMDGYETWSHLDFENKKCRVHLPPGDPRTYALVQSFFYTAKSSDNKTSQNFTYKIEQLTAKQLMELQQVIRPGLQLSGPSKFVVFQDQLGHTKVGYQEDSSLLKWEKASPYVAHNTHEGKTRVDSRKFLVQLDTRDLIPGGNPNLWVLAPPDSVDGPTKVSDVAQKLLEEMQCTLLGAKYVPDDWPTLFNILAQGWQQFRPWGTNRCVLEKIDPQGHRTGQLLVESKATPGTLRSGPLWSTLVKWPLQKVVLPPGDPATYALALSHTPQYSYLDEVPWTLLREIAAVVRDGGKRNRNPEHFVPIHLKQQPGDLTCLTVLDDNGAATGATLVQMDTRHLFPNGDTNTWGLCVAGASKSQPIFTDDLNALLWKIKHFPSSGEDTDDLNGLLQELWNHLRPSVRYPAYLAKVDRQGFLTQSLLVECDTKMDPVWLPPDPSRSPFLTAALRKLTLAPRSVERKPNLTPKLTLNINSNGVVTQCRSNKPPLNELVTQPMYTHTHTRPPTGHDATLSGRTTVRVPPIRDRERLLELLPQGSHNTFMMRHVPQEWIDTNYENKSALEQWSLQGIEWDTNFTCLTTLQRNKLNELVTGTMVPTARLSLLVSPAPSSRFVQCPQLHSALKFYTGSDGPEVQVLMQLDVRPLLPGGALCDWRYVSLRDPTRQEPLDDGMLRALIAVKDITQPLDHALESRSDEYALLRNLYLHLQPPYGTPFLLEKMLNPTSGPQRKASGLFLVRTTPPTSTGGSRVPVWPIRHLVYHSNSSSVKPDRGKLLPGGTLSTGALVSGSETTLQQGISGENDEEETSEEESSDAESSDAESDVSAPEDQEQAELFDRLDTEEEEEEEDEDEDEPLDEGWYNQNSASLVAQSVEEYNQFTRNTTTPRINTRTAGSRLGTVPVEESPRSLQIPTTYATSSEIEPSQVSVDWLYSLYEEGYEPPQWAHTHAASILQLYGSKARVLCDEHADLGDVEVLLAGREPTNMHMIRHFNAQAPGADAEGAYGSLARSARKYGLLPPNIATVAQIPFRGALVDAYKAVWVVNLIGLALDTELQPDYRWLTEQGPSSLPERTNVLIDWYQLVFRKALAAAKYANASRLVVTPIGAGNFCTLAGMKNDEFVNTVLVPAFFIVVSEYDKWISSPETTPRGSSVFIRVPWGTGELELTSSGTTGTTFATWLGDIGEFPLCFESDTPPELSNTVLCNAWNPWSVVGNGNCSDTSMENVVGCSSAVAILTHPACNPYIGQAKPLVVCRNYLVATQDCTATPEGGRSSSVSTGADRQPPHVASSSSSSRSSSSPVRRRGGNTPQVTTHPRVGAVQPLAQAASSRPFLSFAREAESQRHVLQLAVDTVPAVQRLRSVCRPVYEHMRITNSDGTDAMCQELANTRMNGLRYLNLAKTHMEVPAQGITDVGLRALSQVRSLTYLDLTYQALITDAGLQALSGLTSLTHLNLSNCYRITGAGLEALSRIPSLTYLNLNGCWRVGDVGIRAVSRIRSLTDLNLRCLDEITTAGIQELSRLTSLTHLDLYRCRGLTNAGLQAFTALCSLTHLNLMHCVQLQDNSLQALSGLAFLKQLDLSYCKHITDAGLQFLSGWPRLTHLRLRNCVRVTDAGIKALCDGLPLLTHLNLDGCNQVTDVGVHALSTRPSLTHLTLAGCERITNAGVQALSTGLASLTNLNLEGCHEVTDAGVEALSIRTSLTCLNLNSCARITDVALQLVSTLPLLTELSLMRCERITDVGLRALSKSTSLTHLYLCCCPNITSTGVQALYNIPLLEELLTYQCQHISAHAGATFNEALAHRCRERQCLLH